MKARPLLLTVFAALAAHAGSASASWIFGGMASAIANSVQLGETDNCIAPGAKVGDVIKMTDRYIGIVKSVSGPSAVCDDSSQVRARVDVRLSEAVRTAEHTICVARGVGSGDRIKYVGLGEMEVRRVTSSADCSGDPQAPIQVVAVSTQAPMAAPPAPAASPGAPSPSPAQTLPVVPKSVSAKAADLPPSVSVPAKEDATTSTTHKLRELAGMLKDGLITQEDYNAKKQELLKSF
jgi:hypothetical protein